MPQLVQSLTSTSASPLARAPPAAGAARAPPIHHRDAADEEFAEFASAEAAPAEAKPVAAAEPVEAVPAVPRSAATNVLVRLCTS